MKPLGMKPIKFPSKTDCHPPKGFVNWWENCDTRENKKAHRREGKQYAKAAKAKDLQAL